MQFKIGDKVTSTLKYIDNKEKEMIKRCNWWINCEDEIMTISRIKMDYKGNISYSVNENHYRWMHKWLEPYYEDIEFLTKEDMIL